MIFRGDSQYRWDAAMALPNLIRYFRDCYEEDNRRSTLWNIFHTSVTHRIFFEGKEELLTGFLIQIPVDADEALEAKKAAYLYQIEKELVYCSLFIVGHLGNDDDKPRHICAPLLIHPAEIIEQPPHWFLKPDFNARRLNYQLFDALEADSSQRQLSHQAINMLQEGPVTPEQVFELAGLLESTVAKLDASSLRQYPSVMSQRELQNSFSRSKAQYTGLIALSSSAAAIINKSVETRGVVNELTEMAAGDSYSKPVQVLFGGARAESHRRISKPGRVPAVLSSAQQTIIERGATYPVTLVIGPPGTGKSFTIASLAVEHLSRGESVLIASKMNHAVDVVGDKIEDDLNLKGCTIRGGRKQYLKEFKDYLEQLLGGMHDRLADAEGNPAHIEKELVRLDREIESLENRIRRRNEQELAWGKVLSVEQSGFWHSIRTALINYRVKHETSLSRLLEDLEYGLDQRIEKTTSLAQRLNQRRLEQTLSKHRQQFNTFLRAIRARTGLKQEDLFKQIDFRLLLSAIPIWLVNLADIQEVLPLRKDLFDLAIIDEATQCDIASCLPVFQRARRVVISGDPNQLRHLSFLAASRQRELLTKYQIDDDWEERYDYRNRSILDFVSDELPSQESVVFLDEHYRSLPPIIEFSNRRFYADSLRVMTEKPGSSTSNCLMVFSCSGRRDHQGVNEEEANRLITDCLHRVQSERSLGKASRHSIGILSPFRAQADHIAQRLSSELPLSAFEEHQLLIGTAHTFQGEERDIVYISLVVDSLTHRAALRFLEKPDVFNVSITRARIAQQIYASIDPALLDNDSILRAYLDHAGRQGELPIAKEDTSRDRFLSEIGAALEDLGYQTWTDYKIAGLLMDLVVARGGRSCGIDLIGYPGPHESAFPLERYMMFHRAGLSIIPVSYALWRIRQELCLTSIENAITRGRAERALSA